MGRLSTLPGVEFTIYADKDLTEVVATITTDKDGAAYSDYLPVGTYYVVETFTPAGYVADDTVYTVNITGDGTGNLYVLDETKHEFSVSYENDNTTIEVNKENPLINYPQSGTLTVNKVDQNGNPLGAGVEFLVTCVDTGETWTIVTDANGIATLTDLAIGAYDENGTWVYYTYTLQKTKTLDNYKLDDTVYTWQFTADNTNANAVSQTFTVRNK